MVYNGCEVCSKRPRQCIKSKAASNLWDLHLLSGITTQMMWVHRWKLLTWMITCRLVVDIHPVLWSWIDDPWHQLRTKTGQLTRINNLSQSMATALDAALSGIALEDCVLHCQIGFRVTKQYVHVGYNDFESNFLIFKRHMEQWMRCTVFEVSIVGYTGRRPVLDICGYIKIHATCLSLKWVLSTHIPKQDKDLIRCQEWPVCTEYEL